MNISVLVAEDDEKIANLIRMYLEKEGCTVHTANNGIEAWYEFNKTIPDIIIIDIMMPGMDGLELLKSIRKNHLTPAILLSAKDEELDKILGLEVGADDYITKPFSPRELLARIKSVWRRYSFSTSPVNNRYVFPGLLIDIDAREVFSEHKQIKLTPKEFELISLFARNPGRAFSRNVLLEQVWDYQLPDDDRTVDVHIKRLRQKLANGKYSYLQTVWGLGYKFEVKPIENESDLV